ncbi:MAG: GNAT family N-acetyltransferase [Planctomycetota bacterium]|nr:MAG: GNAT family N-acetyltransferase [Planctomycetota bacterium]
MTYREPPRVRLVRGKQGERTVHVRCGCPVARSFRVEQAAGMFGLKLSDEHREAFRVVLPPAIKPWQIGLIVGPSGSGKSTLAEAIFGDRLVRTHQWPADRAVIDAFALPIRRTVRLLTAVGFGSPPSWLKPYRVLSQGERFRCDLARAFAEAWNGTRETPSEDRLVPELLPADDRETVVFDEYTSVVDRQTAKVVSAAVARSLRRGDIPCRFVAVTCHYDVIDWLTPDWVIDMQSGTFHGGCLRRPPIELAIVPCTRDAWGAYRRFHYLSGSLPAGARCYLAVWETEAVAFCATASVLGRRGRRRISRLVVRPEFQGIGIGGAFLDAIAAWHARRGIPMHVTASHPAVIAHCRRSPRWCVVDVRRAGATRRSRLAPAYRGVEGRAAVSFRYVETEPRRHGA